MKINKKIIFSLCVFSCLLFCACSINVKTIIEKTSDLTSTFFFSSTDFGCVEVYCGQREQIFEYDGISTKKVDYGIVKVCFDEKTEYKTIDAQLKIDDEVLDLVLEQNPFDQSYMVDIEKQISQNANLTLKIPNINVNNLEVECQSNKWKISDKDALEIAGKTLKEFMTTNSKNNVDYECYLKVVHNIQDGQRLYFYTFSVKTTQLKTTNILIDVYSGEVLVKS